MTTKKVRDLRGTATSLVLAALVALLGVTAFSEPSPSTDSSPAAGPAELVGVWAGEKSFGPQVRGTLSIARHGSRWHAEIAGYRVTVDRVERRRVQRVTFERLTQAGAGHVA